MLSLKEFNLKKEKKEVKSFSISPSTIKKLKKIKSCNKNLSYAAIVEFSIDYLYENLEKAETA